MPDDPPTELTAAVSAFWQLSGVPLGMKLMDTVWNRLAPLVSKVDASTFEGASNLINDTIVGMLEKGNTWILGQVRSICKNAGMEEASIKGILDLLRMILPTSSAGVLAFPLVAAVVLGGVVSNTIGQAGRKVGRHTGVLIQPEMPGIDVLQRALWRMPKDKQLTTLMSQTGYGPTERWAVRLAMEQVFDMPVVSRLLAMKDIDEPTFLAWLGKLGWEGLLSETAPTTAGRRMLKLAHPIVSPAELSELYRRGDIDSAVFQERLGFAGFFPEERAWHTRLAKRLADPNVLIDLCRRGEISEDELLVGLKQHGFDKPTLDKISTLWRRFVEPFDLRELYWRGMTDKKGYADGLMRHGYNLGDAEELVRLAEVFPTVTDVVRFAVREVYTPEIAEKFGQYEDFPELAVPDANRIGLSKKEFMKYWASHWVLPSFMQGADLFHRGELERDDLIKLARALDIMPFWQGKMIKLTYRLIPRRTLPQLVKYADVSEAEMTLRFGKLGFNMEDAALLSKISVARAFEQEKTLTKAELRDGFVAGWITQHELRTELDRLGYSKTAINYHVQKAQQRKRDEELKEREELIDEAAKLARQLTKAELLKGYREGIIDVKTARHSLLKMGYSETSADFFIQYEDLRRDRETQEAKAAQHKRLFDTRLVSDSETLAALTRFGYTVPEVERLLKSWTVERNSDELLAANRTHKNSRATLERWVKMGLIDVDEWTQGMALLKYTDRQIDLHLQEIATELMEA